MDSRLLNAVETDMINLETLDQLKEFLNPVLSPSPQDAIDEYDAKRMTYFIVKFLRECHDIFDGTKNRPLLIEASLVAMKGLQALHYEFFDDQVTMVKVIHFLLMKVLKFPDHLLSTAPNMCQYLLELLIKMDVADNLPDLKHETPLAANAWAYLWNAFIKLQKEGRRGKVEFKLVSYALRLHGLVAEMNSVFEKYVTIVWKDLHNCDNQEIIDGILDISTDLLVFFVDRYERKAEIETKKNITFLASVASCFALNYQRNETLKDIEKIVRNFVNDSACLTWLQRREKGTIDHVQVELSEIRNESEMMCRSETLYSLMNRTADGVQRFEELFLKQARAELALLRRCDTNDKRSVERRTRSTLLASNVCLALKARITDSFTIGDEKNFCKIKNELDTFRDFVVECLELNQRAFFLKKLSELAYVVIKFARSLKDYKSSETVLFFEKAVEMLEIWIRSSERSRSELWPVYYELSWLYLNLKQDEKCLDLLENVVIHDAKNLTDIAAAYVKCKKTLNILSHNRYLTSKLADNDVNFKKVLQSEFQALKKCKVFLVHDVQLDILANLLSIENEPMERGYLLLEKSIALWSMSKLDDALEMANESLTVLEESGASSCNAAHLARAYLWKYILQKATLHQKYKICRKDVEQNYKNDVNDFSENLENDQSALKFKDSFLLYEEHGMDVQLVKCLHLFEGLKADQLPDLITDLDLLYGIFTLNGRNELGLRTARLMTGSGKLLEAKSLYELGHFERGLNVLSTVDDTKSVDIRLMKSRLLLALGEVEKGYKILEPMCKDCMQFPTRTLGRFSMLLSEYQRLPLEVLGVQVLLEKEDRNPLYLATLGLQCLEQSFNKISGLEPDVYGNLPEKADLKNSTIATLSCQFLVLSEYLEALVEESRRYAEVGEAKHAKTYLQDALVLSLRFCVPKWTAKILIQSANISLLEGRVVQCEEKLMRAHWILNFEFMEMKMKDKIQEKPEAEMLGDETREDVARKLLTGFGFDADYDDVIQSKCLKTNSRMAKQEARSLANAELRILNPANRKAPCKYCDGRCHLRDDSLLARLDVEILMSHSECLLNGGSTVGVIHVDQTLRSLFTDYKKHFENSRIFKDLIAQQKLTMAKYDDERLLPICEKLIEDLSLTSHREMVQCFLLLAEAYYLIGSRSLDSYLVRPPIGPEDQPIKKSLSEQLYSDDENEDFQSEMQQEEKAMKVMNEKPMTKNGRRQHKATEADIDSPDVVAVTSCDDVMKTPLTRVSKVKVVRKARRRLRTNLNVDDDSPTFCAAPRRGVKLERQRIESTSCTDLLLKAKSASGNSPTSVASEDLNQLLDAVSLDDSSTSCQTKRHRVKQSDNSHNKSAKDRTNLMSEENAEEENRPKPKIRTRRNACSDEIPKPVAVLGKTRNATRSRDAENLRAGVENDSEKPEKDDLMGKFRDDLPSPAFRNVQFENGFPDIEILRGPAARGRRKVLHEISPNPDIRRNESVTSTKKERVIQSGYVNFSTVNLNRNYLEEAVKLLRHHPVTSLYRKVCSALGVMTSDSDPWLSAFHLNEAACVAYRHEALLAIQKKRTSKRQTKSVNETEKFDKLVEESISFPKDVEHFKAMIHALPSDWTVVQITIVTSLDSTNHMIATRLRASQTPLIVQCPGFVTHGENVIESLEETIMDSRMRNSNCEDRIRWWAAKRMYSKNVEQMIEKLENDVFGCWKGILLGCYGNSDTVAMLTKKARELLSKLKTKATKRNQQLMEVILDSASFMTDSQIGQALAEVFPDISDELFKTKAQIETFKTGYPMTGARDPLVLVLDKAITNLPVDNMPIISCKPVIRSLSIYSLYCEHLVNAHLHHERLKLPGPEMTNISYILDPDYNLPHTRENFASWFRELGWQGCVGKCPSRQEFEQNLMSTDMMLYLGHGSGQRYFEGTRIQKLQCRAAVILMGCSSGVLKSEGVMEPRGMVLHYLLARSPFVMGNLWDVTDGDIDRFTKALLEYWLSAEPGTKLYSAVQHARNACRLRYLTGGAPVIYGLPL